jgi:PhnB protein
MGMAQISPMLAVGDPAAAIEFYKTAFSATEVWTIGHPPKIARLDVLGAPLFLAQDQSTNPRFPDAAGHTTVRIELFVDDPRTVLARAAAASGLKVMDIEPHEHDLSTPSGGTLKMLQGGFTDPFGHIWLVGKFVD